MSVKPASQKVVLNHTNRVSHLAGLAPEAYRPRGLGLKYLSRRTSTGEGLEADDSDGVIAGKHGHGRGSAFVGFDP